ncbi:MAG: aa3-type cytochrome oxidase subunit II, partial [Nocardioidaceae bacterium]
MLLLGSCTAEEKTSLKRLAQPVGATDRTAGIHTLWIGSWIAAMAVGVLVWGLIIYACVKYRRRNDNEIPVQTRYNLPIEILYTVAPVIMVLVFFYHTVTEQDAILKNVDHPAHTIDVVGQQWSWTFNYVKDKDLPGNAAKPVSQKTSVWEAGTTAYRPTLTLPVNQSVRVNLSSPDVIHSFWVPAFLFKMDVIPGRHNHFSFTPTREGWYKGRCA